MRAVLLAVAVLAPSIAHASDRRPRPKALTPLLAAQAGLQIADAHSTFAVLEAGGAEGNPLARWIVDADGGSRKRRANAFKTGVGIGAWLAFDRLACTRPGLAMAIATSVSALYAAMVIRNYREAACGNDRSAGGCRERRNAPYGLDAAGRSPASGAALTATISW